MIKDQIQDGRIIFPGDAQDAVGLESALMLAGRVGRLMVRGGLVLWQ